MTDEDAIIIAKPLDPPGEGLPPAEGAEPPAASPPAGDDTPASSTDGVGKRIDELTRKRHDAERDAAYWKGVAEASSRVAPAPAPAAMPPAELDPLDFDSNADYLRAIAKQTRDEITQRFEADTAAKAATERTNKLVLEYGKGRAKYPDFDSVALANNVPITQDMFDAAQGDKLSDVLYHLGSNRSEAARIASLPSAQQIKEIGRIEDKLATITVPRTTTGAPNPPTILGGGGGSPLPKAEADMTQTELNAKWEAERLKELGVK